jgi:hypothetical protein
MPWPCIECPGGEKYVERGKRKHKVPLRIQLAEVEAQRDGLKGALEKIADSRRYGECSRLLCEIRACASEALSKLGEK